MEQIDVAFDACRKLCDDIDRLGDVICTEQDTRVQVVDRMFLDVLGYPRDGLATEERSGAGFLDYRFSIAGLGRLVVEAKRTARSLGTEARQPGRAYVLRGAVFDTEAAREGINQAITYCGRKNVELACVTNGREWIVFRGSRLGDGKDTEEGMAFVFVNPKAVLENFKLFYDLLSPEAVTDLRYRAFFQEAEGQPIRPQIFKRPLRAPASANLLEHTTLSRDVERVMSSFFRKLSGDNDPELLRDCFVVTKESASADKRLARIAEDLVGRIRNIGAGPGEQLTELIARAKKAQRHEFIIIVGMKGAGKSTFVERFFTFVLPKEMAAYCTIIRVDLSESSGDDKTIVEWLDARLIDLCEAAVFGNEGPDFEELQGMFFDEYTRKRKGPQRHLYQKDKDAFKQHFGDYVERRREEQKHDFIRRVIRHIVASRKKIPCIVFDNADHFTIEFQERVFQYARSIYESELCLIIVPITDRTSWQLSREGALQSFDSESLYLPVPPASAVIETRIKYLDRKVKEARGDKGAGYFFGRGIELSIDDLNKFVGTLQTVFMNTGPIARAIEYLGNQDIRRCLEIARDVISSPHLRVDELLKSYVSADSMEIDRKRIERALIRKGYDIYPVGQHKYVQNIYYLHGDIVTTPLLGLRILQLLRDVQRGTENQTEVFITVDQVVEFFRAMTVEPRAVLVHLEEMLKTGLAWSYDPTVVRIRDTKKVEISPAGFQHLLFGMEDWVYMESMLQVTPLLEEGAFNDLYDHHGGERPDTTCRRIFAEYVLREDRRYVQVPDHLSYASQSEFANRFMRGAGF